MQDKRADLALPMQFKDRDKHSKERISVEYFHGCVNEVAGICGDQFYELSVLYGERFIAVAIASRRLAEGSGMTLS